MTDERASAPAPPELEVFPHAPVSEAILGIAIPYADDLSGYIELFHNPIRHQFPVREFIDTPDLDDFLWPGTGVVYKPPRKGEPAGYKLLSEDGLQIVQLTRRALTYHRLRPYVSWSEFASGALPVWRAFSRSFAPDYIGSLRLRYINRIEIPNPVGDLEEYLNLILKIPKPVDTGFIGYLMRLSLVDPPSDAVAHVTQIAEYRDNTSAQSVLFDIDVRMDRELPPDEKELWASVEILRDYKNRIFFHSITEKTKRLFR